MDLIGFGFKAGVGKDAASDYLVKEHGWVKKSFAENLKNCCVHIFGLTYNHVYDNELKLKLLDKPIKFNENYYNHILWWMGNSLGKKVKPDNKILSSFLLKELFTPRDILQFVGTEIMREHIPDYHVVTCLNSLSNNRKYVICDVRFPNEAKAIEAAGGYCVKITRKTVLNQEHNKTHASETAMDNWNSWFYEIDNSKEGLHFLYNYVDKLVREIENVQSQNIEHSNKKT